MLFDQASQACQHGEYQAMFLSANPRPFKAAAVPFEWVMKFILIRWKSSILCSWKTGMWGWRGLPHMSLLSERFVIRLKKVVWYKKNFPLMLRKPEMYKRYNTQGELWEGNDVSRPDCSEVRLLACLCLILFFEGFCWHQYDAGFTNTWLETWFCWL